MPSATRQMRTTESSPCAGDPASVARDGDGPHRSAVAGQRSTQRTIGNTPDAHVPVVCAGDDGSIVRAENSRRDRAWMVSVAARDPSGTRQSLTVPSTLVVARSRPSGLNAILRPHNVPAMSAQRRNGAGWNHNTHYHYAPLERVPRPRERALDARCGTGSFCEAVVGDRAPRGGDRCERGRDPPLEQAVRRLSQRPIHSCRFHDVGG